jgi:hypothetical protein
MNITQQVSASVGTALFSVLLTNDYNEHAATVGPTLAIQSGVDPRQLHLTPEQAHAVTAHGLHFMGQSFGSVFLVAAVLIGLCLIPACLLPRTSAGRELDPSMVVAG